MNVDNDVDIVLTNGRTRIQDVVEIVGIDNVILGCIGIGNNWRVARVDFVDLFFAFNRINVKNSERNKDEQSELHSKVAMGKK